MIAQVADGAGNGTAMFTRLRAKFEEEGLEDTDRIAVKAEILKAGEPEALQVLVYMYGYSFPPDEDVARVCTKHITEDPYPGLTAACMNVLADIWCRPEEVMDAFKTFLNRSMIEEWYDEAIFVMGFVDRNPDMKFPPDLLRAYVRLKSDPSAVRWIGSD